MFGKKYQKRLKRIRNFNLSIPADLATNHRVGQNTNIDHLPPPPTPVTAAGYLCFFFNLILCLSFYFTSKIIS